MIGREPKLENKESSEQQLIRLLKEKGTEDPETQSLLLNWTLEQEKQADESTDRFEAIIQFNLRRARLYFEAGYLEEAFENFEAAAILANQVQGSDLYQKILDEVDILEKTLK